MPKTSRILLEHALHLQEEARNETASLLDQETSIQERLVDIADGAAGLAEIEICLRSDFPVDCEAGCVWCCYQRVTTSPVEILRVAHYLRQTLDLNRFDSLVAHVQAVDSMTHGLDRAARLRLRQPCPLLTEDGNCLAYAVRPLPCRGYTSRSARTCQSVLVGTLPSADVEADPVRYLFCQGVLNGVDAAVAERELEGGMVELISALAIALAQPSVETHWWNGERIFTAAQVARDSIDGPIDSPSH